MRIARGLPVVGGVALTICAASVAAQDANYWHLQYGPVAQLLGGQVIASSRDLSATFYNPGALALEEGDTFLLSTESVQLETYSTTSDSDVQLFDTSSTRFGTAPTLVAGNLPRRWLGEETRLAWSFLTRQKLEVQLGQRLDDPFDLPGGESATELYLDQEINESWAGFTVSRALSETLGVGLTLYGIYRGQHSRSELNVLAVSADQAALTSVGVTDFRYYHFRALAKLGVAWERGDLRLGLNLTTPSARLFGSGEAGYTLSLAGADADGNGIPDPPVLRSQTGKGLPARYKSSWAIGGGLAWSRGATRWHASAEWFAPVDRFNVVDLPGADPERPIQLTQQLKGVANVGLGVEHDFGNERAVYGAVLTDFSASVGDPAVNVAVSNWNLYHLSSGVKFAVAGNRFTLGATFSFGSKRRPFPSTIPPEALPEAGLGSDLDVRYSRVVVLLGFLFGEGS
jgi:hypothetical protein